MKNNGQTSEQLEERVNGNRAAVSDTLEELNSRLSPGEIMDEVLSYMKGGGNDFINNLGRQVANNPLPVTLIGAGIAWFLFAHNQGGERMESAYDSNSRRSGSAAGNGAVEDGMSFAKTAANGIGDAASSATHKIGDMASDAAAGLSDAMHSVQGAASSAYQQAHDGLDQVGSKVSSAAMKVEEKTVAAARSVMTFLHDQPLVLAGVGIALGAAIGAALPSTEMENRMVGDLGDELKDKAHEIATDQLENAKSVGRHVERALSEDYAADSDLPQTRNSGMPNAFMGSS